MVWVHGGALTRGANALDSYDGSTFARDGIVVVAINYRLGSEGFSVLDDAPLNLGLLDVMAALRWVRSEIRAFGGDPEQVTVAGQSAGASLIAAAPGTPARVAIPAPWDHLKPLYVRDLVDATAVARSAEEIGMVPIRVRKEQPGCVLNSLLVPFLSAAALLFVQGLTDVEAIDPTWRQSTGAPPGPR